MAKAKHDSIRTHRAPTRRRQSLNSKPDQQLSALAEKLRAQLCEYTVLAEKTHRARAKIEPLWKKLNAKYPLESTKVLRRVEQSGPAGRKWRAACNASNRASSKMWRTADQIFLIRPETAVGLAAHALALAAINWWPSQGGFEFEYDTGALIFNACRVGKMAVPEPVNASLRRNATEIRKYAAERRAAQ